MILTAQLALEEIEVPLVHRICHTPIAHWVSLSREIGCQCGTNQVISTALYNPNRSSEYDCISFREAGTPNWVGYFISKYAGEPLYIPGAMQQSAEYMQSPFLIYDYAKGGDTVTHSSSGGESGLAFALEQRFLIDTVKQHKDLAFEDALFGWFWVTPTLTFSVDFP